MIMEFNIADPIQSKGLQGRPKKLHKGNADVETGGQPIMFAPVIEKASQMNTQGDKNMIINSPLPGKEENPLLNKEREFVFVKENNGNSSKDGIDSGSLKYSVTRAIVEKDDSFKKNKVEMTKDGKDKSNIKNLLKHSDLKGEGTIVGHEKTGFKELTGHNIKALSRETDLPTRLADKISPVMGLHHTSFQEGKRIGKNHTMGGVTPVSSKPVQNKQEAESGSLKSGLTLAAIGKDRAFKKSRGAVVKNGGGKNDSKNLLKYSAFKGEGTKVDYEKTGFKELTDHNIKVLPREIASPARFTDRISSVAEYHQTSFNADGKIVMVNENVNSSSIEPRVLINQVAKSVNGPGRVKISLTPPHLGTLNMDVLVKNNKVQIIIQAENNDVRQILQSNVETLKNALSSQGLIADSISVIIQEKSDNPGNFGFGREETLFKEDNNQKENQENPKGKKDSLDRVSSLFDEESPLIGIDGRISFFV